MITTNFQIKDRTITKLNDNKLIGIVGQDKFHVDFIDEAWEGLHKTLKLIRPDGAIIKLAILNNEVILTQECYVEGMAYLGFFGTINEDDPEEMEIASTDYITINFIRHAYDNNDDEETINLPTPTQWDIIINQLNGVYEDIVNYGYPQIKNKPKTWNELVGGDE